MASVSGGEILARALKNEGVDVLFNLPGDPMNDIVLFARDLDMRVLNFRHEQAAAMAAQAYGYAERKVGVAVVSTGPGMTNAVTGLATAWSNCWPFLLIGGSGDARRRHRGDFQEMPQVEVAAPLSKWAVAIDDPRQIPYYVNSGVRRMMGGRPGPVYLDLPSNVIGGQVPEEEVRYLPPVGPPARPQADPQAVRQAVHLLAHAQRPLLLVGKGVAWSDAAAEARQLVERLGIPFVPSPMGKGVIPDDHPLNAAAARSFALAHADVVLLAGARFNWVFHFGQPPRFAPDVKVIHLDIEAEEIGNGVPVAVALVGDARAVLQQVLDEAGGKARRADGPWLDAIRAEARKNARAIAPWVNSDAAPMGIYRMYKEMVQVLDRDATVCADGAMTMDISRAMVPNHLPRHRLDAGVSGCMGVSVPYAIGAQAARPGRRVVSLNGDWAFGWNGFEIEMAVRYNLPILFLVANNVTVGGPQRMDFGLRWQDLEEQPEGIRYDRLMEAFGGHGEHVETPQQLRPALERALASGKPSLVNVVIEKARRRKEQPFDWLERRSGMRYMQDIM